MDRFQYCLFCLKPRKRNSHRSEISKNWRAISPTSVSGFQAQREVCVSLEKEVQTVFIVRKLLSVKENVCHSMLESFGNPSSWLNVCLECEKMVKKASDIHSKIVFLQKSLEVLKTTTKERIHESESRRRNRLGGIKEATLRIREIVLKDNCDDRHRGDIAGADAIIDIKDEPTVEEAPGMSDENEELSDFIPDSEVTLEVEAPPSQNHVSFKRPRCSRRFTAKSRLRHQKSVHHRRTVTKRCNRKITKPKNEDDGNTIIKCPYCHYNTNRRSTLSRHLNFYHWKKIGDDETIEHAKLTEWQCTQNQCTKVFNDNEELVAHCTTVHKMATCPLCPGLFPNDILVQYHLARHHGHDPKSEKQILKCHRCDFTSTKLHCFIRHRRTVHWEHHSFFRKSKTKTTKRCNQCRKDFENMNAFKHHCISDHQMISCNKCPRLLMPHQIMNHEKIVHGIGETECSTILDKSKNQLYKCRHCTYSSKQERDVRIHQRYFHWEIAPDDVGTRKASRYKCDKCNADYLSKQTLCDHKIEVHGMVQCDQCSKLYLSVGYLEMHRDRHHNEEIPFIRQLETRVKRSSGVIKCKICLEVFESQPLLKTHQLETHTEDMFACENCDEVFVSLRFLYKHKVVIHKEQKNPYKCPLCNYTNMKFREIERHKQTVHEKTNKFICEICSSSFRSETYLSFHMARYHGRNSDLNRNKMSCDICNKSFSTPSYLKYHIKTIHHNQWIYKCEECGRGFKSQKQVDIHTNSVHRKLRLYDCTAEGCNKKFRTSSNLGSHIRSIHTGQLVQCSYCEKEFKDNSRRKRHEKLHVNEKTKPYQCHKCGKGFADWGYLRSHFKSHMKAEELDPKEFQQLLLAHNKKI